MTREMMTAGVLTGPRRVEIRQVPVPPVTPGMLKIRVSACGVCGSDIHLWQAGRGWNTEPIADFHMGHEFCGVVVDPGDSDLQTGERVAMTTRRRSRPHLPLFALGSLVLAAGLLSATHPALADSPDRRPAMQRTMKKFLGTDQTPLATTDPELAAIRDRLVYGEIMQRGSLTDTQRLLVTLVALAANRTPDGMDAQVRAALRAGATPVEIKEALYQCAPYIGFPATEAALRVVNDVFAAEGIALPTAPQATVSEASRFADGLRVQKRIFGDAIDAMHRNTPPAQLPIMKDYLSAFCFGDIYTRTGLDLKTRELLTFSIIAALGGCDAQVRAHVQGNVNVGNSKDDLIDALAQLLPCIGFPRTLNALACVNAVIPEKNADAGK